jgi:hypothetical protein
VTDDPAAINRANWNVWAAAHGQDAYYDSAGLVAGADSLTDVERAGVATAVNDVDGLEVPGHEDDVEAHVTEEAAAPG